MSAAGTAPGRDSPHRVGRIRFEVDAPDEAAAHVLRSDLTAGAATWIPDAVDTACRAVDDPGRTVRLDRLEVTVEGLDGGLLTPARLADALLGALAARLRAEGGSSGGSGSPAVSTLGEALGAFLASGHLPWWSPAATLAGLEAAWEALDRSARAALAWQVAPALASHAAARRLVLQVRPATAAALVQHLPGVAAPWPDGAPLEVAIARAAAAPDSAPAHALAARIARAAASRDAGGGTTGAVVSAAVETGSRRGAQAPAAGEADAQAPAPAGTPPAGGTSVSDLDAAIPTPCAGLVLLHPFLPALLEARGLLVDGALAGTRARWHAVHLAAWLASGSDTHPEPDLALPKLLCGLPTDAVVPRTAGLVDADRLEGTRLLEAAIGHWEALGASSVEGLRETFLRRQGRLHPGPDAWRLTVEGRGTDVLLDRLPWALGPVRLPWMRTPLLVEWR